MEREKAFRRWMKAHEEELVLGGIAVALLMGAVLLYNANHMPIRKPLDVKRLVKEDAAGRLSATTADSTACASYRINRTSRTTDVREHIRALSNGRNASAKKASEALAHNISLAPHQTWVESHRRTYAA